MNSILDTPPVSPSAWFSVPYINWVPNKTPEWGAQPWGIFTWGGSAPVPNWTETRL